MITTTDMEAILKDETMGKYINMIAIKELKDFTIEALELDGTTNTLNEANQVAEIIVDKLTKRGMISKGTQQQQWIDLLLVATILHNLYYDHTKFYSVFYARQNLTKLGPKHGIPVAGLEPVFQAIEGQLGDSMPVPACRSDENSPIGMLADACWYIEEKHGSKKMPNLLEE